MKNKANSNLLVAFLNDILKNLKFGNKESKSYNSDKSIFREINAQIGILDNFLNKMMKQSNNENSNFEDFYNIVLHTYDNIINLAKGIESEDAILVLINYAFSQFSNIFIGKLNSAAFIQKYKENLYIKNFELVLELAKLLKTDESRFKVAEVIFYFPTQDEIYYKYLLEFFKLFENRNKFLIAITKFADAFSNRTNYETHDDEAEFQLYKKFITKLSKEFLDDSEREYLIRNTPKFNGEIIAPTFDNQAASTGEETDNKKNKIYVRANENQIK